jgi:hypothetical protein
MNKRLLFLALFFCFFHLHLSAQRKTETLGVRIAYLSSEKVSDLFSTPVYPKNAFENLKVGAIDAGVWGNYAFNLGENTQLKLGLDYGLLHFRYEDTKSILRTDTFITQLHSLNLPIELRQKIGNGWQVNLQAKPGIASNWQSGINSKDFLFQGFGYLSKAFKEDESLVLGLGLSYNTLLGKPAFLPLIDFYWQTEKFKIDAFLPYYGGIYYLPSQKIEIGLQGRMQGNRYNLNKGTNLLNGYTEYNWIFGGLAFNFKVSEQWTLGLDAGVNANRTYEVHWADERKIADYDPAKFKSWYAQMQLKFSIE